jgi:exopolysaccharide production protein ExoY
MLIRMPRGSPDQPRKVSDEEDGFEAGLRRDLASAPVVSYDAILGGWRKRALDIVLTLLAAPVWLPIMAGAALWARFHHAAPVFVGEDRIGYGNRAYRKLSLSIAPPRAVIAKLRPDAEGPAQSMAAIASNAEDNGAKWRRALERLPQFINVLRGEMSLVGPLPLSEAQLEPLKMAKRYYLSARPGVIGVSAVVNADEEQASQYKIYALSWSLSTDALILWDAVRSLKDRGELWRPTSLLAKRRKSEPIVVRNRSGAD